MSTPPGMPTKTFSERTPIIYIEKKKLYGSMSKIAASNTS